jgi:hypothetical protein
MQIKFEATKLKEANEYVNLLTPKKIKKEIQKKEKTSFLKKVFGFLFR